MTFGADMTDHPEAWTGTVDMGAWDGEDLTRRELADISEHPDALSALEDAVKDAVDQVPAMVVEDCTDPEGTDVAELLATVREAREALQGLERDLEAATAKAMLSDYASTATLRVERSRRADRKQWDHQAWQRDVRAKAIQAAGLKGAQGIITADGEVIDAGAIGEVLLRVESVRGAAAPKVTGLRNLGLDPDDYATRLPGTWSVKVTRLADEGADE